MRHNHYTQPTSYDDRQHYEFAWRMPPYSVHYHPTRHHHWLAATILAVALLAAVVL